MQFKGRLATEQDSDVLCRLLEDSPMDGEISITLERQPNYFYAAHVQCSDPLIIVASNESSRTVGGVFAAGTRPVYVNGSLTDIRYLSDMRISPSFRKGLLMPRGFKYLKQNILKKDEYAQTLVLTENKSALKLLTSQRANLPYYHSAGDYNCYAISTQQKINISSNSLNIRRANCHDLDAMQLFFDEEAKTKQFYPYYDFSELKQSAYYRDIAIHDFFLAFEKDKLAGIAGLWDQTQFKQIRVQKYSKGLSIFRPIYNLIAPWYSGIKLPKVGSIFNYLYLHSIVCRNNSPEILRTMLKAIFSELSSLDFSYVMLGLDGKDSLNGAVKNLKKLNYPGKHFLVSLNRESPLQFNSNMTFYFEAARI